MSRIPKWKIEKSKVKVVFRLQFHATHIPQPGWDKLFVSFIPADTGKVTGKTTKANVKNGTCKWSDPIYETTRLLHDPKTKDYDEKLYKLVVAMGSSGSSMLGEVVINLADFADALKPSSASFPLHVCDFGTILHVTVQLLTSKTGFREFEQQRELSVKGFQASSGKRSHNSTEVMPVAFGTTGHIDKVNSRVRFKGSSTGLPSLEEVGELDEEYEDSAAGVDGSSCTSESVYAEKNDVSSIPEIDSIKSRVSGDLVVFSPNHSSSNEKGEHNYKQLSTQLGDDWIQGWNSDYSIDKDLASTYEDTDSLTARLQVAECAFLLLKSEAKSLQNISDELSAETQHLSHQLAMELDSGEKLTREVNILKSEYWKFKNDLEELKVASVALHISRRKTPSPVQLKCCQAGASFENDLVDSIPAVDSSNLPSGSQSKLLQGLFLVECKAREIQNKACFGFKGSQFDYFYSEFGVLVSLIQNLKQIIAHESSVEPVDGIQTIKNQYSLISQSENYAHGQSENYSHGQCLGDLRHSEGTKEKNMCELQEQLDASKTEVESLAKRMVEMECYYEALIHELEDGQKQTADQMENLRAEHSSCFYTISALQNQAEKLHQEMNGQLIRFSEDRHSLEISIKALEKRAISSETMLKRVRWNYAIAVDRLQKDLELLSFQVLSMYEANENLAKQVVSDASEQHDEHLEMQLWHRGVSLAAPNQQNRKPVPVEVQQDIALTHSDHELSAMLNGVTDKLNHRMLNFTSNEENKGGCQTDLSMTLEFHIKDEPNTPIDALKLNSIPSAVSIHDVIQERKDTSFSNDSSIEKTFQNLEVQVPQPENQRADDKVGSEEMEMSLYMPKQLHESIGAELLEEHMLNIHLQVYSEVLHETLRELFVGIWHMNWKVAELEQKIELCTNEREFMSLKLIAAMDVARKLREAEAECNTKFNDLVSKNHIMEVKLNDVLNENSFLVQKMTDCHSLIEECRVYESKYNTCATEKNELQNKLQEEKSHREYLQSKISSLSEEFKSLMERYDNQCSLNFGLQKGATHLQGKLRDLCNGMIFLNQKIGDSILDNVPVKEELNKENYDAIISHLENFQQKVCCKLFKLQQEKKVAEELREVAQCTLNETESRILCMNQKFESEFGEIRTKVELSSTKIQHLQVEFEGALEKLNLATEAEERLQQENRELLSKMSILEVELQQTTDERRDFYQKLLAADSVNEELAKTKSSLMDFIQENRNLQSSIHSGNEASIKMENELFSLKESMQYAHDKLQSERKLRDELEVSVSDLKLLLEKASNQLLSFDEQNAELCYLRTRVVDLEGDLRQYEVYCQERERNIDAETSSIRLQAANMENYLVAALEHSLSADVEITFMRNQLMEYFVYQKRLKSILEELHLKHLGAVVSLEKYIAKEAGFIAERERLFTDLQSEKIRVEVFSGEREALLGYIDANTINRDEYDDLKAKTAVLEDDYAKEKHQYEGEICKLKSMLLRFEELDELWLSKVRLDILVVYLGSKLSEQQIHISLHEECDYELRKLREQHIELNQKLSEQILKTEEFKNLSIHLRELKDKANADCHQACERRESEGSSLVVQDSLRIVFIKEQCEFKIQELRNQCSASRKYTEEMLMKLQNALDENETRKKNEASLAKRNDEMSILLSDLNSEMKIVVADRRELIIAYDRMKAELECTILSLECCKEEKLKLQNSLKESSEEREKIKVELDLVKHLFENMASTAETRLGRNYEADNSDARLIGELLEDGRPGISVIYHETSSALGICSEGDQVTKPGTDVVNETIKFRSCREVDYMQLNSTFGDSYLSVRHDKAENLLKETTDERATLVENNSTQIAIIKESFEEQQRLMTGMELLHKQLQRLRDENLSSDFQLEEHHVSADLQCLQRELSQLDMANEQLGSIFPTYRRLTGYGNAIERVLALELELAESLQVKKKSESRFQSSFLKQHNDDEAVFQSFKDINELIKDMLELRKRNAAAETELLEMHGRYSQLSLQYAEVEGERQKLVMSLKNRSPKKS